MKRFLCRLGIHHDVEITPYILAQHVKCHTCGKEWDEQRTV